MDPLNAIKKEVTMATVTRVGYCPHCANSRSPRTGQQFIAFGSTSNEYHVLEAIRNGMIGYTPHIYKAKFRNDGKVNIQKSCGMYECGVDRQWRGSYWYYYVKEFTHEVWTLETWNALVLLKHDQFTQMYEI